MKKCFESVVRSREIAAFLLATGCLTAPGAFGMQDGQTATWHRFHHPDGTPVALDHGEDLSVWPNAVSCANSDPWIAEHHDQIRQMRPRLLLVNFANDVEEAKPMQLFADLIAAVEESSRYHGYAHPDAPIFLDYETWKYVDLRDPGSTEGNSPAAPIKPDVEAPAINCDYGGFFTDEFAVHLGVRDPGDPARFLRLDELVDRGFVHELWFTASPDGKFRTLECVELKPLYDEQFRPVPGEYRQSGNGGDDDQPWTGRSLRLNGLNHTRGIGCGMENLGHSFEGMSHGGAIPYFTHYFREFAGFDLDERFDLPFESFYRLWGEDKGIEYPDAQTAIVRDALTTWTLENYRAQAGNVHFPPNGRRHYDQDNPSPVLSNIEHWRCHDGPGGEDLYEPWTNAVLEPYAALAPDCMGKWQVYWRQNIPGLDNRSIDDNGRRMKNWWVFLFY